MKIGNYFERKRIIVIFFTLFIVFSFAGSINAITGSIGNARMILRPEVGDTLERSILVKNVNEVDINVELSVIGDLEEDIKLVDESFLISAGGEKKAYFTIDVKDRGTTETKINVKFTPVDGGNGVGLSSTIIVIPEGGGSGSFFDIFARGDSEEEDEGSVSFGKDNKDSSEEEIDSEKVEGESNGVGAVVLGGIFSVILFVVLLIVLAIASKNLKKKGITKSKEKETARNG